MGALRASNLREIETPPPEALHMTLLYVGDVVDLRHEIESASGSRFSEFEQLVSAWRTDLLRRGGQESHAELVSIETLVTERDLALVARVNPSLWVREIREYAWESLVGLVQLGGVHAAREFLLHSRTLQVPAGSWLPHITISRDLRTPVQSQQFTYGIHLGKLRLHQ